MLTAAYPRPRLPLIPDEACRGGSFAVKSVAAFTWNGWQPSAVYAGPAYGWPLVPEID